MDDKQKAAEQKKRLEQLSIHLRINLIDLAEMAGLNKNTLYHVGSGVRGEMSERTAARICYHLEKKLGVHINRDWLLDGVGEMIDEHLSVPYDTEEERPMAMAAEEGAPYGEPDYKAKYLELMEEHLALQRRYMELIEGRKK